MKKLLLIILVLGTVFNSYCQNMLITQLTSTAVSGGVNVNVKTVSGMGAGYLSNSYFITGNVINLSVCYWFDDTLPVLQFNNDFIIPLTTAGDYTINVQIKLSTSQVTCDNFATTDNGTISVNYLATNNFEKIKESYTLFPNPSTGNFEFKGSENELNSINVYDNFGKMVFEQKNILENNLNLKGLNNGIYYVKFQTENGNLNQKIIIKK